MEVLIIIVVLMDCGRCRFDEFSSKLKCRKCPAYVRINVKSKCKLNI